MLINNKRLVRRQLLRVGFIGGVAIFTGVGLLLNKSEAIAKPDSNKQQGIRLVINALRSTGNVDCLRAADGLDTPRADHSQYDLHLRNAGLRNAEIKIIAEAIRSASLHNGPTLRSLSFSYNPGLTDKGIIALIQAIPHSLHELGLVACAIGDEGGDALIRWCKKATGLKMICVEGNRFSTRIRQRFASLAQDREDLIVVV